MNAEELGDRMNEGEYSALMSLIGTLSWQFVKQERMDKSSARGKAASQVGASLVPPLTGPDLEKAIGLARQRLFRDKRIRGQREAFARRKLEKELESERKKVTVNAETIKPTAEVRVYTAKHLGTVEQHAVRKTVIELYKEWVLEHDTIPLDAELAHFNGKTPDAFGLARTKLVQEGYRFEKKNSRWHVVERPDERKYTKDDVEKAVRSALFRLTGKDVS